MNYSGYKDKSKKFADKNQLIVNSIIYKVSYLIYSLMSFINQNEIVS